MIPSNNRTIIVKCVSCGNKFEHAIITKQTKQKKFCPDCVKIRKQQHNQIAKDYRATAKDFRMKKKISLGSIVGRPHKEDNKLPESKRDWETSDSWY